MRSIHLPRITQTRRVARAGSAEQSRDAASMARRKAAGILKKAATSTGAAVFAIENIGVDTVKKERAKINNP